MGATKDRGLKQKTRLCWKYTKRELSGRHSGVARQWPGGFLTSWRFPGLWQKGRSVLFRVSVCPSASFNCSLRPITLHLGFPWLPDHGSFQTAAPTAPSVRFASPHLQTSAPCLRSAQSSLWQFHSNLRTPHLLYSSLRLCGADRRGQPAAQPLQLVISFVVTEIYDMSQIITSNASLLLGIQYMEEQMLSFLPGIRAGKWRRGP